MKVLLIKDVYKLGHAGDVKRVADGYGRNFLLTKSLAVLATPGALKQIDHIKNKATARRAVLNNELGAIAEQINGLIFNFSSRAGETGKLYGSITSQQITDALNAKLGTTIDRHQVEVEPVRTLGEHKARIRLTVDLNPEIKVVVYREGESPASATPAATHTPAAVTLAATPTPTAAIPAATPTPAAVTPAATPTPAAAIPAAAPTPAPEHAAATPTPAPEHAAAAPTPAPENAAATPTPAAATPADTTAPAPENAAATPTSAPENAA
jgi:large subunit ribosomal protein L9